MAHCGLRRLYYYTSGFSATCFYLSPSRPIHSPATMLWVDKHRPRSLDKIIAHEDIAQNLKKLVRSPKKILFLVWFFVQGLVGPSALSSSFSRMGHCLCLFILPALRLFQVTEQDCPHLLFYGPTGSGKKTLIVALLKEMFGPGVEKVSI